MTLSLIDPAEDLVFGHDWSDWLGQTTIANSIWSISPDGPVLGVDDFGNVRTSVEVSGCTFGRTYTLTNTITAASGETGVRAITLRCASR